MHMSIKLSNRKEMFRFKYRPGFCLLCGKPIQKIGPLWCMPSHRNKHDRQLKIKPVLFWLHGKVICRTANALEQAIRKAEGKIQKAHRQFEEFNAFTEKLVIKDMYEKESRKSADKQDKNLIEYLKKKISELRTTKKSLPPY